MISLNFLNYLRLYHKIDKHLCHCCQTWNESSGHLHPNPYTLGWKNWAGRNLRSYSRIHPALLARGLSWSWRAAGAVWTPPCLGHLLSRCFNALAPWVVDKLGAFDCHSDSSYWGLLLLDDKTDTKFLFWFVSSEVSANTRARFFSVILKKIALRCLLMCTTHKWRIHLSSKVLLLWALL